MIRQNFKVLGYKPFPVEVHWVQHLRSSLKNKQINMNENKD